MVHEIVLKSVFDNEKDVKLRTRPDKSIELTPPENEEIDSAATTHWMKKGVIISEVKQNSVILKKLETKTRTQKNNLKLETGV